MKTRKAYLLLELDADEIVSLPPHLRGLLQRPLIEPLQTRRPPLTKTATDLRAERLAETRWRAAEERKRKIKSGELDPPE
jgi:hypothetical protein